MTVLSSSEIYGGKGSDGVARRLDYDQSYVPLGFSPVKKERKELNANAGVGATLAAMAKAVGAGAAVDDGVEFMCEATKARYDTIKKAEQA